MNSGNGQAFAAKFINSNKLIYYFDYTTLNYLHDSSYLVADTLGNIIKVIDISKLPVYTLEKRIKFQKVRGDFCLENYAKNVLYDSLLNSVILTIYPNHLKGSDLQALSATPIVYAVNIDNDSVNSYPVYLNVKPDEVITNWENFCFADIDESGHIAYISNGKNSENTMC